MVPLFCGTYGLDYIDSLQGVKFKTQIVPNTHIMMNCTNTKIFYSPDISAVIQRSKSSDKSGQKISTQPQQIV